MATESYRIYINRVRSMFAWACACGLYLCFVTSLSGTRLKHRERMPVYSNWFYSVSIPFGINESYWRVRIGCTVPFSRPWHRHSCISIKYRQGLLSYGLFDAKGGSLRPLSCLSPVRCQLLRRLFETWNPGVTKVDLYLTLRLQSIRTSRQ